MARFRGIVKGNRGEASRNGFHNLTTEANGWEYGIRTEMDYDEHEKATHIRVFRTSGSNGRYSDELIYEETVDDRTGETLD